MTVELFAHIDQTNPQRMLADLMVLYALNYGLDTETVKSTIKSDMDTITKHLISGGTLEEISMGLA